MVAVFHTSAANLVFILAFNPMMAALFGFGEYLVRSPTALLGPPSL